MYDFDRAQFHKNNRVWLDIQGGPLVRSFLTEDVQYGLGNHWEAPFASLFEAINGGARAIGQLANAAGMNATQRIFRNLNQTVSQWTGSERFSFSLTLMFMATQPDDDVRVPVAILHRLALPSGQGRAFGTKFDYVLYAPNNYRGNTQGASGAVAVTIGTWFQTPSMFLVRTMNPLFSKTHLRSGLPQFAVVSITLETYRLVTADEVNAFFPAMPSSGGRFASISGEAPGVRAQ